MRRLLLAIFVPALSVVFGADIPPIRLQTTTVRETSQVTYHWRAMPVAGGTAQLLTLFRGLHTSERGGPENAESSDVPLVSVLRDTLGDSDPENDRVSYVWLLSYVRPNLGQRILSAVPFFYWRVSDGSKSVGGGATAPLMDLTAPQHPVVSEIGRNLLQWTTLDPMIMPVRATSRAYRTNQIDDERLHLEEAIGYLRNAPVSNGNSELTQMQLDTVVARLELRKRLLGGLVSERRAAELGRESGFDEERIRSRNWELLRQCAEKTQLIFEPLNIAQTAPSGNASQYAILWFPLNSSFQNSGTSLGAIWKLLNIKNPWNDARLKEWRGRTYDRSLDGNGSLLPAGTDGPQQVALVPLGIYSLNYPKLPLLLVDFRDKIQIRRHEMAQRSINEITSGVIGISHFTNWYYYVAADIYDFVTSRHGAAMSQAERLDCYSRFGVDLALDHTLDATLHKQIQDHLQSFGVNPLESAPHREIEIAQTRYSALLTEAEDDNGKFNAQLERDRRAELAVFGETGRTRMLHDLLHDVTLGRYTHRAKKDSDNLAMLDRDRRIDYQLSFLDSLIDASTPPEVTYSNSQLHASLIELSELMPGVQSSSLRTHAETTIEQLRSLSRDAELQTDCSEALLAVMRDTKSSPLKSASASSAVPLPGTVALAKAALEHR